MAFPSTAGEQYDLSPFVAPLVYLCLYGEYAEEWGYTSQGGMVPFKYIYSCLPSTM